MRTMNRRGFTLIEMLMVILLIAILAAVAVPQFVDFRTEAKNAAVQSALGALRTGIATQIGQVVVRCQAASGTFPTAAQVAANDITTGGVPCTAGMVPVTTERQFVPNAIPSNPWSGASAASTNSVAACVGLGCTRDGATACTTGAAFAATDGGWCYNPANGTVWANSANNGVAAPGGEYSF